VPSQVGRLAHFGAPGARRGVRGAPRLVSGTSCAQAPRWGVSRAGAGGAVWGPQIGPISPNRGWKQTEQIRRRRAVPTANKASAMATSDIGRIIHRPLIGAGGRRGSAGKADPPPPGGTSTSRTTAHRRAEVLARNLHLGGMVLPRVLLYGLQLMNAVQCAALPEGALCYLSFAYIGCCSV
jgi:hypothetical protein